MGEKLIIENQTNLEMEEVLRYINAVIHEGKISEGPDGIQYCFHTSFSGKLHISAYKNKESDRLVVYKDKED